MSGPSGPDFRALNRASANRVNNPNLAKIHSLAINLKDQHGIHLKVGNLSLLQEITSQQTLISLRKQFGTISGLKNIIERLFDVVPTLNNRFGKEFSDSGRTLKGIAPIVQVPRKYRANWTNPILYGCIRNLAQEAYQLSGFMLTFGNESLYDPDAELEKFINAKNVEKVFIMLLRLEKVLNIEEALAKKPISIERFFNHDTMELDIIPQDFLKLTSINFWFRYFLLAKK